MITIRYISTGRMRKAVSYISMSVTIMLIVMTANGQTAGNCEIGVSQTEIDVNEVVAPLSNSGTLFDYRRPFITPDFFA